MSNINKISPIIWVLVGFGFLYLGNMISAMGGIFDAIGVGISLFGSILIIYSIIRGGIFIFRKLVPKKK